MTVEATAVEPVLGATPEPVEQLGEGGIKALKAERERAAAAEKALAEREAKLKEYEDREKTEEQKTLERIAAAEARAAELELKATRAEVAAASGVPVDLLSRVSGSAEDSQTNTAGQHHHPTSDHRHAYDASQPCTHPKTNPHPTQPTPSPQNHPASPQNGSTQTRHHHPQE